MSEAEFDFLRGFLKSRSGLALTAEKRYLVESRLAPVCQQHGLSTLADLVARLRTLPGSELARAVIEAMTTNETLFFRDRAPFDLFRDVLLPGCLAALAGTRRLRIWCAAAATGQEPYSLAMILRDAAPRLVGWTVEIVATDISAAVIEKAKAGLYSQFEVQRGLPIGLLLKHFRQVGANWQLAADIRAMVEFRQLNLLQDFAKLGTFDVVFCRNVLIYFDAATKTDVLRRLARAITPAGVVVLGAAETVIGLSDALAPHPEHRGIYVAGRGAVSAAPPLRIAARR